MLQGLAADTSLSHAEGFVAVALSLHGPVGVDVEPASRVGMMREIADRICHPDERARIAAHSEGERGMGLLELWVRKEAFLKAAGVGLGREMDTFVLPEGEALALHPGEAEEVTADVLSLGPGVVCAVARRPDVACVAGWARPAETADGA